jgi:hypothetical protein
MKHFLLIAVLLPFYLQAQECPLKKDKDAYTGKHSLSTGFFPVGTFSLSIDVTQKEIDYFFVLKGSGNKCFNEQTTLTCLMEGGKQKFMLRNKGAMNCDGILHVIMANNANTVPSALQKLSSKKITSIRITFDNGTTVDCAIDEAAQKILMDKSACIAKEAKTVAQ